MILGRLYDLAFDHTCDLDLGVSRSEAEIAFVSGMGQPIDIERKGCHQSMTRILTSVTTAGWADVLNSDRGDFRRQRAIDISSYSDEFCTTVVKWWTITLANTYQLTHCPLGIRLWLQMYKFKTKLGRWHIDYSSKYYLVMTVRRFFLCQVNIGSGNGLMPSGTKPLPYLMLTKISDAIFHL